MTPPSANPPSLEAPALKRFSLHIRHGFFGRRGGVSSGAFKSLNCALGSGDASEKVAENRRRACLALGLSGPRLALVRQVHSARAVRTIDVFAQGEAPEADAVVTSVPGLALGVLTADCAPVLLCDPHAGVIGAAHAGWRGAVSGVLEAAIDAMAELGADPSHTVAAIGPCLSQASFEVGPDLVEAVLEASPWAENSSSRGGTTENTSISGRMRWRDFCVSVSPTSRPSARIRSPSLDFTSAIALRSAVVRRRPDVIFRRSH